MLIERSVWSANSEFPAHQPWADDAERILAFLQAEGVLDDFLPRLLVREWEGAFAEARVGYFLKCNGFTILRFEPREVKDRPGDIDIQWKDTEPIFVEVKGPGWEGELSDEERRGVRRNQPKYINAEARFLDTFGCLNKAIDKALPKFAASRANLVATADDLFMGATEMPLDMLEARTLKHLNEDRCTSVGGVLFLNPVVPSGRTLEYRHYFIANPKATKSLPEEVVQGLRAGNWREPTN